MKRTLSHDTVPGCIVHFLRMRRTLLLLCLALPLGAAPPESFFLALHAVETGGKLGAIRGDNGAALGPYQLHRAYWLDSGIKGSYSQCSDLAYSRAVVSAYMRRYAPKAWAGGTDLETLAKIHNGGPNAMKATGQKLINLNRYWKKIQEHLK